jgi:iron complex transport system ATP-binding protein
MSHKQMAQQLAVVSQQPATGFMRLQEYVLLGRTPHYQKLQFFENKKDIQIMEQSLEQTGLGHFAQKPLAEMSVGEQQLAAIARALCQQPQLLILDEPTSFLDITHQVAIMDLIRRLNREQGLTVIMVLHDLNLASEYCHRLLLLNQGRTHKLGTPEEVLTYATIEEVYQTVVLVKNNPISNRPYIFPISREYIQK